MAAPVNWRRVLETAGVEYVERGPNVKRGEINIRCPFCGSADPSHHLGLNLETGWWACWRNQTHRGKSPVRLLVRLLRVSVFKAREIAGLDADYIDPDGFDAVAARVMDREKLTRMEEVRRTFLDLPREFKPITATGWSRRHWEYLVGRGFREADLPSLIDQYCLRGEISGPFKDRVILPYYEDGDLVTWTARAIVESQIRYKDLSPEESAIPPKQTLYNLDAALGGGEVLLVVEGPFDVLKLDFYGRDWGVRSVGLSTNSMTEEQVFLIEEAGPRFARVLMMMDNGTSLGIVDSLRLKERLAQVRNLGFTPVPHGYKDGGDLPPSIAESFCRGVSHGL